MLNAFFNKIINYRKEGSLVRDNFVLFIATMILNGIGFLYHFIMGRVLGPQSYGILGTLLSMAYFLYLVFNLSTRIDR